MLKRLCAPLTLANQLALVVLLLALLGLAGMAVSAWLIQGIQGSAHAINKAGSLRMQSYRLLAAVPLKSDDNALLREIEQTAWDPELQHIADRDGERRQLDALHDYWRNRLAPAL
ncbi:type IV pili methyl-accepting chemotaxis transducer N-terminal domain-containing protein, partial [Atlantibacter hermannii]